MKPAPGFELASSFIDSYFLFVCFCFVVVVVFSQKGSGGYSVKFEILLNHR